ncbi:MAG: hypothetical protein IKQ99_00165 [Alphaproteobacteria bacterium]|nr:hypothetical protein [Alphaproteobacteria bacterium]
MKDKEKISKSFSVYRAGKEKGMALFLPSGRVALHVLAVPGENHGDFGFDKAEQISSAEITNKKEYYSPRERAEFLYEAITAKDKSGKYLFHNICLGGGNGADDTIDALEKLLKEPGRAPLPKRAKDLNIFGFSDASQLHHYLGQRGIATQVYYSAVRPEFLYQDIADTLERQKGNKPFLMNLEVVNNPENKTKIEGFTQPGSITSVEHRPTHQLRAFPEGSNMLVIELTNQTQIERLAETLEQMKDKNISLVLSKDMTPEMVNAVKDRFKNLTIFSGALMGHGNCIKEGKPIPLFAESHISINGNKAQMEIFPFSCVTPKKAEELSDEKVNPKRIPKIVQAKDAQPILTVTGLDKAGRAIISDLTQITQGAEKYTIHIRETTRINNKGEEVDNGTWQKMELGIKELLEHRIIDPDKLKQLEFTGACDPDKLSSFTQHMMQELAEQYLPHLQELNYSQKTDSHEDAVQRLATTLSAGEQKGKSTALLSKKLIAKERK